MTVCDYYADDNGEFEMEICDYEMGTVLKRIRITGLKPYLKISREVIRGAVR